MYLAHHPNYGTEHQLGNRFNWPDRIVQYRAQPYVSQRKNKKNGKTGSKFVGVQKTKSGKYAATVYYNKKTHYLCQETPDEEAAAKIYDDFVYKNKLNRKFNFPERHPDHNPATIKTLMTD